jgi:hypothetical protein
MKLLTWLLGVMVIYLGVELTVVSAPRWWWVWVLSAVIWFFAGIAGALLALGKLVTGKAGAGALSGPFTRRPPAPAPHKEE